MWLKIFNSQVRLPLPLIRKTRTNKLEHKKSFIILLCQKRKKICMSLFIRMESFCFKKIYFIVEYYVKFCLFIGFFCISLRGMVQEMLCMKNYYAQCFLEFIMFLPTFHLVFPSFYCFVQFRYLSLSLSFSNTYFIFLFISFSALLISFLTLTVSFLTKFSTQVIFFHLTITFKTIYNSYMKQFFYLSIQNYLFI